MPLAATALQQPPSLSSCPPKPNSYQRTMGVTFGPPFWLRNFDRNPFRHGRGVCLSLYRYPPQADRVSPNHPRKAPTQRRLPSLAWLTGFPRVLGSANPCPTAVDMEPFPSAGLQAEDFSFNVATTTKICTRGCSTFGHPLASKQPPRRSSYSSGLIKPFSGLSIRRRSLGNVLERHPFSGPIHSAGKLLHTS